MVSEAKDELRAGYDYWFRACVDGCVTSRCVTSPIGTSYFTMNYDDCKRRCRMALGVGDEGNG